MRSPTAMWDFLRWSESKKAFINYQRGKYVSDAEIAPWEHDAEDTYDAIDWVSKQEWCNGKVRDG